MVKIGADELKPALQYCTHLVYGYAGIDGEKLHAKSLDAELDLPGTHDGQNAIGNFRSITALKKDHPNITVLLSVGGNVDSEKSRKYLTVVRIFIIHYLVRYYRDTRLLLLLLRSGYRSIINRFRSGKSNGRARRC